MERVLRIVTQEQQRPPVCRCGNVLTIVDTGGTCRQCVIGLDVLALRGRKPQAHAHKV